MSIKYPPKYGFKTAQNAVMLGGATEASYHLKFRLETDADPARTTMAWIFGGEGYVAGWIAMNGAGAQPGTVKVVFTWRNSAGTQMPGKTFELAAGAAYTLGMVFSQTTGHRVYINGQRTSMGALTGTMPTAAISLATGVYKYDPIGAIFSVEDAAVWNGHALTDQQVADLRDGVIVPADITSGTWRGLWTMKGTPGATVVAGDGGLLNSVGDHLYPMSTAVGTGTATYGPEMVWEPTVEVGEAYVGTGGKTLFCLMRAIASGHDTLCQSSNALPTIKVDGTSIGTASLILADGNMTPAAFLLPRKIEPGEAVTMTAPANWLGTVAGAAAAVVDGPVVNHSGESCFRDEDYPKTLRMGVNAEFSPQSGQSLGQWIKNWTVRLGQFPNVTAYDANWKPIAGTGTSWNSKIYDIANLNNGIDATGEPGPTGLFAVQLDDTNPAVPTTVKIYAATTTSTVVTPRTEYDNPGTLTGGVLRGRCWVFDAQRKPGSTTYNTAIGVQVLNAQGLVLKNVQNLCIMHEVDFTPVLGGTVLDNSDPYRLSDSFLDLWTNTGSVRCWPALMGGVDSPQWEIEHSRPITDFAWGYSKNRVGYSIGWTEARPFSMAEYPYFYSSAFGDKYPAMLSANVDASATVFTIAVNAGQGNEVIIGSRLFLGSEVCRVTAVSGNQYTVVRGIERTTPAAHSAGTIQVGYRMPIPVPGSGNVNTNYFYNGHYFVLYSPTPHGLASGYVLEFNGSWPNFTYASGGVGKPGFNYNPTLVIGPNTLMVKSQPWTEQDLPLATLPATLTLNPAQQYSACSMPKSTQMPYAMAMRMANQMDSPSSFISIPTFATDDLIYWIAGECLTNLEAGRLLYIENANELWNFPEVQGFYYTSSAGRYPGTTMWATYLERLARVRQIFESVWSVAGRAADIRMYINQHTFGLNGAIFDYAANHVPPIQVDAVAIAPYFGSSASWVPSTTMAAFGTLEQPELHDVWIHHHWYATNSSVGPPVAGYLAKMGDYATRSGFPVPELVSYEGGLESILSSTIPDYKPKEHDFFYHPIMYIIMQDVYALLQSVGFSKFNQFCSFAGWGVTRFLWGIYNYHYQQSGKGDGSDGKANNLLCLARPGYPASKAATVNQDANCVSPVGLAWLEWNGSIVDPPEGTVNLGGLRIGASPGSATGVASGSIGLTGLGIGAGLGMSSMEVTEAQKILRYIGRSASTH